MKPATFTLDVKGLELPDNVREDISMALNATLMRKLGEMNLTGRTGHEAAASPAAALGGNIYGKVVRIDGGEIIKLISRRDFGTIFQKSLENVNVLEAGIEKIGNLQQFGG